jgi:hypothetical protein
MAHRAHRRGGFGRKTSAFLRSLFPVVLGLGGWALGALLVMTTRLSVPLDNASFVALSVGCPIALGIFWAWVRMDRSGRTRLAGLSATAAGAFAGAWLGFHAIAGLTAPLAAIAGAVAGANLALILLEAARDRAAARARSADRSTPGATTAPLAAVGRSGGGQA